MYCSNCGYPTRGNFCSCCGASLETEIVDAEVGAPFSADEVRYDVLLQNPLVRQTIAGFAGQATRPMSAERFLELCDMVLSPAPGLSFGTLAAIAHPIYSQLGLNTGKSRTTFVPLPAAPVLIGVLCSFALRSQTIRTVTQAEDGCLLEVSIPSDFRSFEADLFVAVERMDGGTRVAATAEVKGQLFDWGKSNGVLDNLFSDLAAAVSTWPDDACAA
jgi:hypothetical protein